MRAFGRMLMSIAVLVVCAAVFSAPVAAAPATASLGGVVVNASTGAVVSGAKVELVSGSQTLTTTSNADGAFSFDNVPPGGWALRVTALQYQLNDSGVIPLSAGQSLQLTVALQPVTSTGITTIGHVLIKGQRILNTSSAPAVTLNSNDYVNTGSLQVQTLLESQPGITIEHFDNGAPGNVTTFTIRGTGGFVGASNTGYEVLVLQDGEPLRNGEYGDYDLSALTPAIYSRVEVVKGVGGTSLFGANTIGGTLNLVTIDPKSTEGGQAMLTVGGYGTSDYNLAETDTFGRFGYVIDLHRYQTDGFIPANFPIDIAPFGTPSGTVGAIFYPTLQMNLKSGLAKVRYNFSDATYAVITASDESDWRDQTGLLTNPSPYMGQVLDPIGVPFFFGFPDNFVWNTSPKYAFDLHTVVGGGSLVLRAYDNWINRWVDGNSAPPAFCCFLQKSIDHLTGDEAIWDETFGNHDVTLAIGGNGDTFQYGSASNFTAVPITADEIPVTVGTQIERTALARDDWDMSPKFRSTLALYYSNYNDLNVKRFDPRLAILNRPDQNSVIRVSVGTGFAAPRLSDIVSPLNLSIGSSSSGPNCTVSNPFCNASQGNPKIQAETGIGYDVGYERTWGTQGDISVDLYRTNLTNHIFDAILPAPPGLLFSDGVTPVLGIITPINIAGAVYTGMEFSGAFPITDNFTAKGYYNTQASYPINVDLLTQQNLGNVVNNQQFLGVPLHKIGWSLNFQNRSNVTASFGADWFGPNNSYNVPSFWVYNAGFNMPLGDNMLHLAWQNIFDKNASIFSNFDGGVPYPSIVGFNGCTTAPCTYLTTAFSSPPHYISVSIDHRWGSLK